MRKAVWMWMRMIFLWGAVLLCFTAAVYSAKQFENKQQTITLVIQGQQAGVDYAFAKSIQEENRKLEEPLNFANWGQLDEERVSGPQLGTNIEADILFLYGRSDLLFPGYPVLDCGNQGACLISSALSEQLFGNKNTQGLQVEYQGRMMDVLGVIEDENSFLVYEIGPGDTLLMERASVECRNDSVDEVTDIYRRLCGDWVLIDYGILNGLVSIACLVVPFIIGVYILYTVQRYARESKNSARQKQIWNLCFFVLLIVFLWRFLKQIQIPADMIPDQWSDFEFWLKYIEKKKSAGRILVGIEKKIPDMLLIIDFSRTMMWTVLTVIGEIVILMDLGHHVKSGSIDFII